LAAHFELRHLDTGLTYRAVAEALLRMGIRLDNEDAAIEAARSGLDFSNLDRQVLSAHQIGEAASRVAIMPALRRALVEKQRAFASEPPGAVLDGRDIGTVVLPDAAAKLFVTASPEARARRRMLEMRGQGADIAESDVLADIRKRDARDMGRSDSPLRPASDAYLLDTTDLDIEAAFRAAVEYVSGRIAT
jgi:cytidylate kinase